MQMKITQSSDVLVLVALEIEVPPKDWKSSCPIAYMGVGKVNAALVATEAISRYQPKIVVNLGTAGALDAGHDGICEIKSVVQRDFDTSPLAPRGVVPFQDSPCEFFSNYGEFRCGTGDSFMTQRDSWVEENRIQLVDMELYSVAQACFRSGTPWRSAKFITDVVGQNTSNDWQAQLKTASEELQIWFRENIETHLTES